MLNTGIVGLAHSNKYLEAIRQHPSIHFVGVFDPGYLIEPTLNHPNINYFISFEQLLVHCDALIFPSDEKSYFPMIEKAIRSSKAIFLDSTANFSVEEHFQLLKLKDEADEIVQIFHPYIYHKAFFNYLKRGETPLLIQSDHTGIQSRNLLPDIRASISAVLILMKRNVKKVVISPFSTFTEIPDMVTIRIDFDNGSYANLLVNSFEQVPKKQLKVFEYNAYHEIDLNQSSISSFTQLNNANQTFPIKKYGDATVFDQLHSFYYHVLNHEPPLHGIENEISTQYVIERVKEKFRIGLSVF